jgi:hypothetical protein
VCVARASGAGSSCSASSDPVARNRSHASGPIAGRGSQDEEPSPAACAAQPRRAASTRSLPGIRMPEEKTQRRAQRERPMRRRDVTMARPCARCAKRSPLCASEKGPFLSSQTRRTFQSRRLISLSENVLRGHAAPRLACQSRVALARKYRTVRRLLVAAHTCHRNVTYSNGTMPRHERGWPSARIARVAGPDLWRGCVANLWCRMHLLLRSSERELVLALVAHIVRPWTNEARARLCHRAARVAILRLHHATAQIVAAALCARFVARTAAPRRIPRVRVP